jgi:anthranilate phosphoribosyltransferase
VEAEIRSAIGELLAGRSVPSAIMADAIGAVMDGRCNDVETAALLTALAVRGEDDEELAGAARAMRDRVTRISTTQTGLLDTCGTGGDSLHTFNISTATALVAAGAGVPVAKHGNRSVSSSSGSADVLEALGVNIDLSPEQVGRCIDEVGIGFCFARLLHSAMKHVAPVRAELGFRTLFNLVGPLTNPAGAEFQLIGANRVESAVKLARAVARLGTKRTIVVCGDDQLDEVAVWGETTALIVAGTDIQRTTWTPDALGLSVGRVEDLQVASADASATVIREVLAGATGGPAADIVTANAAAALLAAGRVATIADGLALARETISSGQAAEKLEQLRTWTTSVPSM